MPEVGAGNKGDVDKRCLSGEVAPMLDERFRRDGLLVFDQLFAPDLIGRVRETVEGWTGPIDPADPPLHLPVSAGRLHLPVRLEGPLLDPGLLFHPLLEAVVGSILDKEYLVDNMSLVTALPGAPMMHLHRDHAPLFPLEADLPRLPPYAVTLVVPLIETDADSGTTMVARGSFDAVKTGDDELSPNADWAIPHVPLGGCFLVDYRLWHRGLPNRSDRQRPLLYAMFARSWFTDTVNFNRHARMAITRDDLLRLAPAQRYRLRRAAAAGLIDGTVEELGAASLAPGDRDSAAGIGLT